MQLSALNRLDRAAFTELLGGIFEHSPWIAAASWAQRPFTSVDALHTAMCQVLAEADEAAKLALIRAHPELAGKAAIRGELTAESASEQRSAGLDACSPAEYAELTSLNRAYGERFGFPFILAVRGFDRAGIIANLKARVANERAQEFDQALRQVERIARFRLTDLIRTDSDTELQEG